MSLNLTEVGVLNRCLIHTVQFFHSKGAQISQHQRALATVSWQRQMRIRSFILWLLRLMQHRSQLIEVKLLNYSLTQGAKTSFTVMMLLKESSLCHD